MIDKVRLGGEEDNKKLRLYVLFWLTKFFNEWMNIYSN